MGFCNSKDTVKEVPRRPFDPVNSSASYKSTTPMLRDEKKNTMYDDVFEMEHQILKNIWKGNLCSEIREELKNEKKEVLDIACGPGHWIRDMSNEFPKSRFTGTQASPCYKVELPPNTDLLRMDVLHGLSYGNDSFDYVHIRCLNPSFSESDWKIVINEMIRLTKPKGTVEIIIGDYECEDSGPIMNKLCSARCECLKINGIKVDITKDLESLMRNTQKFVSLEKQTRKIPIGRSSRNTGVMMQNHFSLIIGRYHEQLSLYMGQTPQEFEEMLTLLNSELDKFKNTNFQSVRIFGKKIDTSDNDIAFET